MQEVLGQEGKSASVSEKGKVKVLDITVKRVHETARAVLFSDGDKEFWVPKSMLADDGIIELVENKDGTVTLTAPEWWLIDRELI